MWVQGEAQLIGRTARSDPKVPRGNPKPKFSKQTSQTETCECEDQDNLPGLELERFSW